MKSVLPYICWKGAGLYIYNACARTCGNEAFILSTTVNHNKFQALYHAGFCYIPQ